MLELEMNRVGVQVLFSASESDVRTRVQFGWCPSALTPPIAPRLNSPRKTATGNRLTLYPQNKKGVVYGIRFLLYSFLALTIDFFLFFFLSFYSILSPPVS